MIMSLCDDITRDVFAELGLKEAVPKKPKKPNSHTIKPIKPRKPLTPEQSRKHRDRVQKEQNKLGDTQKKCADQIAKIKAKIRDIW